MSEPSRQDELGLLPVEYGGLFSENFLETRLPEWADYREVNCRNLMEQIQQLWEREGPGLPQANEAQVEEHFVQPILELLGHAWTPQAGYSTATGRSVPDYALFLTDEARRKAAQLPKNSLDRFHDADGLAEAKEFERPFNTRRGGRRNEDPHAQILRYLNETRVAWGILTNGRWWRLYSYERATQGHYYGVDLVALLERCDPDEFRRFAAFFSRSALEPDAQGRSLLDRMLREAEQSAIAVGDALEEQVFRAVPLLAKGLLGTQERSEANLATAFENSLVFLYRMLFCLHAESRGLLPVDNPHYEPQSLLHLRREVAEQRDGGVTYSERSDRLYSFLRALFRIVDEGEPAFDVNAYNGGLFSPAQHPYFEGRTIPDPQIALAIDLLSRIHREFVDFRDLSVRHLGTIYEKLLAYRLAEKDGNLVLEESPLKHRSGSYFTPERVVDAIVARTLEPALLRLSAKIAGAQVPGPDALERFLQLRICDPASGSGHFLVAAVEYVAQFIATDPSYGEHGEGELLELGEIRRLVAERCIYGVDINPMAVELARLSLWLATVDREQPLTFLENLRVGNSIVGTSVQDLLRGGKSVFSSALARGADELLKRRAEIVAGPSATTEEVRQKEQVAEAAEQLRQPIEEFADEALGVALGDPEIGDPFHWEVEFPEVFLTSAGRPREDAGFDAIVGNPPYIQIQSLGRPTAEFCRGRYEAAAGSFDAYVIFLERSLELLNPSGRLGFIVPNKFTKLEMAAGLRGLLTRKAVVEEMLDFGDAQLFGATNYTAILVLDAAGGRDRLLYRKLPNTEGDPIAAIEDVDAVEFNTASLGEAPWMLVGPNEKRILDAARTGSQRLADATGGIFTGLQTSADDVYIVRDVKRIGSSYVASSAASGNTVELEPDLLHPLASGPDVDRYAFHDLRDMVLFPYGPASDGAMKLLPWEAIEKLPRTASYLRSHEERLRSREGGKMDGGDWYAFGRTQSLALHDLPKLGVAATVRRLEVAPDLDGAIYFHNVRVNGILAAQDGPSLDVLLVLLNSSLLDFLFRLHSVPLSNQHFAANKQFIEPLPIKLPDGADEPDFGELGRKMHAVAGQIGTERRGFLGWLGDRVGADPGSLAGKTKLSAYDIHATGELLDQLAKSAKKLKVDPGGRAFRDQFTQERSASVEKLQEFQRELSELEAESDQSVYEVYGIVEADRRLIDDQR